LVGANAVPFFFMRHNAWRIEKKCFEFRRRERA